MTATNGVASRRVFRDRPGRNLIEEFMAHVRATAQPETFHGLHLGPIAKDERFLKLAPFTVDRKKRPEGNLVPCPMCQPNKYLSGTLIYLPMLQAIAAIGHCCADKDTLAAAEREYKERTTRDQEEDYLLAHVPLIPACLAVIEQARPAAREALRVYRQFRNTGAEFQRALRPVKKVGGRLTLTEQLEGSAAVGPVGFRSRGSNVTTRDIEFGTLHGMIALNAEYNPVGELDRIAAPVGPHNHGDTEESALQYITTFDVLTRHAATAQLREAAGSYSRFQKRISDFCAFFARDNIDRIREWASHPTHPQPFDVILSAGQGVPSSCMFRNRSANCRIVLNPVMWAYNHPWPEPQH